MKKYTVLTLWLLSLFINPVFWLGAFVAWMNRAYTCGNEAFDLVFEKIQAYNQKMRYE